jgi:DNA modification methylase
MIRCCDCIDGMRELSDKSIDLTVTSPPYDNLRAYQGYSFQFEDTAKELYRVTKDGGVVVWVVGDATINGSETGTSFKQALYFKEIGFNLHDTMIYKKVNSIPLTHNRYEQCFEFMFILSKGVPKTFNPIMELTKYRDAMHNKVRTPCESQKQGGAKSGAALSRAITVKYTKIRQNIFSYKTGFLHSTLDDIAFKHPAIFPEQLATDQILSWSNPGDTVLDPFMGSGTTGKMAIIHEREFVGFEVAKEYFDDAEIRINNAKEQGKIAAWF